MLNLIPFFTLWINLNAGVPDWFISAPVEPSHRLNYFSTKLIGKPYQVNPLGEDLFDVVDQDPLFRFDQFDCMTFVETVMALSFAQDWNDFNREIIKLRYDSGIISFDRRHHFIEGTWIKSAQQNGYIRDITSEITDGTIEIAKAKINLQGWQQKLIPFGLGYSSFDENLRSSKLKTSNSSAFEVQLSYIPKNELRSNPKILNNISDGSVVFFLVGSDSKYPKKIGTQILVSHVGLVFHQEGRVIMRHASSFSRAKRVIEDDLNTFLNEDARMPALIGIHVEKIKAFAK